jgi:hypothetical protein
MITELELGKIIAEMIITAGIPIIVNERRGCQRLSNITLLCIAGLVVYFSNIIMGVVS